MSLLLIVAISNFEGCETAKHTTSYPDFYKLYLQKYKSYLNEHSQFITIDNVHVHYRDEGNGPVLILLHGFASSLHTWDGWTNILKNKFRIIRMDILGFGITGPSTSGKYSTKIWIDFIHKFVNAIKLDHFHLVGNSLGGYIAWKYANEHPEKVDKLILIDSVGYSHEIPWIFKLSSSFALKPASKIMFPKFIVRMCVKQCYHAQLKVTSELINHYYGLALREGNINSYLDIIQFIKEVSCNAAAGNDIKKIQAPVLVMWGENDCWIPVKLIDKWKTDLPAAITIVYEETGHVPMEERPEKTALDAYSFLMELDCLISGKKYIHGKKGIIESDG